SRSSISFLCAVVASACVLLSQRARAEVPESAEAPATSEDAKPAAPPPQADTPRPISEAPPAGPPKERSAKNAIYVEGLGAGGLYSVNYERAFGDFSPRVGFSYISVSETVNGTNGTG